MIRAAQPEDADAIWALLEPVFRAGDTYTIDTDISRDDALAYWMDNTTATYVFEGDDGITGTFYIRRNQAGGGSHVCNCGYIVSNAARGQGVARQMCDASQSIAKTLGFSAMQFNFVVETNVGAIGLWTSMGFETVGRLAGAFDHPQAGRVGALIMYKDLSDA